MDNLSELTYLSSKDAGALLGYTHDYISRLCRQGKMSGIQKGREWYVTREELELFKVRHQKELAEKKKELSKKFSKIRREAEARKRQARLSIQNKEIIKEDTKSSIHQEVPVYESKKLSFAYPKQMIATFIFAFIFIVSLFTDNTVLHNDKNFLLKKTSEINEIIYSGIEQTIYTQATIVPHVASVFESVYDYLTPKNPSILLHIPQYMYVLSEKIGSSYLVLYVLQGQAIYYSFENLYALGSQTLFVYELMGQVSWYGLQDISNIYKEFFGSKLYSNIPMHYMYRYVYGVKGGFTYIKSDFQNITNDFFDPVFSFGSLIKDNINQNMINTIQTLTDTKDMLHASVFSIFEFNLVEKEQKIRVIKSGE